MSKVNQSKLTPNQKKLGYGLVAIVILWLIALLGQPKTEKPRDDYYTGPRESKNNPGVWTDADGHRVPPPPGWTERHPGESTRRIVKPEI